MRTFATKARATRQRPPAVAARAAAARVPPVRNILHGPQVQPKLKIGAVNDPAEAEADRVADQVMRMPEPAASHASGEPPFVSGQPGCAPIRRLCAECEEEMHRKPAEEGVQRMEAEEDEEQIQTKKSPSAWSLPTASSQSAVQGLRGGGSPLPASERAFFEPRFGRSFEDVRVHTGRTADAAAKSINARAFTLGRDIAFASGEYSPGSAESRRTRRPRADAHRAAKRVPSETSTRRRRAHSTCRPPAESLDHHAFLRRSAHPALGLRLDRPRRQGLPCV